MGKITDLFLEEGIALSSEQQQKMLIVEAEFEALQMQVTTLQPRYDKFLVDVNAIEHELQKQKARPSCNPAFHECPFCQQLAGQLREIRPDNEFNATVKRGFYECGNCGCHYDRTMVS